jgi:uncharacterized membrane protein
VSTILLAYLFLQEAISASEFLGTTLVVIGATLVATSPKRVAPAPAPST